MSIYFCRNASYKLYALPRIRKYLTLDQAKPLYNTFINSQFSYAPIIWIFCWKSQFVFNSNEVFDDLLQISNEIAIHKKYLYALICEVFKSLNYSDPEFMWSYFIFKNITCNIRNGPLLKLPDAKSTFYSINSVHFRACLLWNGLSHSVKHSESILELKRELKELGNVGCSCILCR